jgi:cytochrome c oxidase cbb3-type subunit 3
MKQTIFLLAVLLAASGCDRETRLFSKSTSAAPSPAAEQRTSELRPGNAGEGLATVSAPRTFDGRNAYDVSQGKRLFRWYNCAGCHSNGGGGMGPALMDDKWRYGHEPEDIYTTIMQGRPNGMPSFRGRIPNDQAWQLVAYVRSMGGLAPREVGGARSDSLPGAVPGEARRKTLDPVPDTGKSK